MALTPKAVTPTIEFSPWYGPSNDMTRCSFCGAVVMSCDQQLHVDWHEGRFPVQQAQAPRQAPRRTKMEDLVCLHPDCTKKGPHSHGKWTEEGRGE